MSRRRRMRVTPLGYIVLGIIILIMVIGILFIVWSLRSDEEPAPVEETPGMLITPTPSLAPVSQTGTAVIGGGDIEGQAEPGTITLPPEMTPTPTLKVADTPPPPVQTPSPEQVSKAVDGKTTGNLYLRQGPGKQYGIIATYEKGSRLKIYSKENGYYFVMVVAANRYGYMSEEYVEKMGLLPGETATPVPAAPAGAINGKVNASEMMLRSGPGKDYRAIGQVSRGEHVYIYFKTGDFYYIQVVATGQKCYGFAKYITAEKTVPSGTPVPG